MATKESNKIHEIPQLENAVSNILVINQAKFRPYIELFHYTPENITLSPLGEMLGFFQISDLSEDSAYIVNFLTSVIKKEYYANPKRSISASMDAALHRVNLALAETAKHGNINWVGKINAAVCVLEKNNLHFSVTGNARMLLIRKQSVIDISEDFSENKDTSPLKTFTDVSSGRLEANDKIIISTEELFNLFSLTELKKASNRFAPEKFTRFIRTALINETELAGTFVIDLSEKKAKDSTKPAAKKTRQSSLNAFSGKTFQSTNIFPQSSERKSALQENSENYTDKKTGHIYIQEQQISPEESSSSSQYALVFKEKMGDFSYWTKKQSRRLLLKTRSIFKSLQKQIIAIKKEYDLKKEKTIETKYVKENDILNQNTQETPSKPAPSKNSSIAIEKTPIKININQSMRLFYEKIKPFLASSRNFSITLYDQSKNITVKVAKLLKEKLSSLPLGKIIPNFSKIKRLFRMFNYQQKIYASLIIILIVIGPLIYLKIKKKQETAIKQPQKENIATIQEDPTANSKNLLKTNSFSEIGSISEGEYIFTTKKGLVIVGEKSIFTIENDTIKNNPFLENIGTVRTATYMKDLDLIFILTENNKIFSFSPVTHTFTENSIIIPPEANIIGSGTYLTYLYLIDKKNNQIYRYPRAEGGFGIKTDWLKDSPIDISSVISIALDENIYLATNNDISKFFKGQKEPFKIETTTPSLSITSISTTLDGSYIYVLDQENTRVAVFKKDGAFLKNYANEMLAQATSIVADESNKKLYAITKEKIIFFDMN